MPSPSISRRSTPWFDNDNRGGSAYRTRRSTIWMARPPASPTPMSCSTTAKTTASPRTTPARSSRPGTPLCARVMSGACSSGGAGPAAAPRAGGAGAGAGLAVNPGAGAELQLIAAAAAAPPPVSGETHRPCSQWQGLQDHGQPEHRARRHRDPGEDRKTRSLPQPERNEQGLMGPVSNCRVSPTRPPGRSRTAWMHCARRARPRISGTRTPSGSSL